MEKPSLLERYHASMLLSGAGDALGFKNGGWEFCNVGKTIHAELEKLGGLGKIEVSLPKWKVSDDTIMHIATAEALIEKSNSEDKEELYLKIAEKYKQCMNDMFGRSPGATCMTVSSCLRPNTVGGYHVQFNQGGGGCGAAMRAMCIGLRYLQPEQLDELIAVAVESGRMTHHHPTGYLGSLASALFTSYAIQGKPINSWGKDLLLALPKVKAYIESQGRFVQENLQSWSYFTDRWQSYLKERGILDGQSDPKFPSKYGVDERDTFYERLSYAGWGGASGHDAPMIAYDGLLAAGSDWDKLCKHAMFHGGDSDSTGVIAAACFGAMYGFESVPPCNYKKLEYKDRITNLAIQLYKLSHPEEKVDEKQILEYLPEVPSDNAAGQDNEKEDAGLSHEQITVNVSDVTLGPSATHCPTCNTPMDEARPDDISEDEAEAKSENTNDPSVAMGNDIVKEEEDQSQATTQCSVSASDSFADKPVPDLTNTRSEAAVETMDTSQEKSAAKVPRTEEKP